MWTLPVQGSLGGCLPQHLESENRDDRAFISAKWFMLSSGVQKMIHGSKCLGVGMVDKSEEE
jgi:hypothetical protein